VCDWTVKHTRRHAGLQDRILLNYTRIENAHKVCKKTFDFLLCIEVQKTFSFPCQEFENAGRYSRTTRCFSRIKDITSFDSKFKDNSWRSRTSDDLISLILSFPYYQRPPTSISGICRVPLFLFSPLRMLTTRTNSISISS